MSPHLFPFLQHGEEGEMSLLYKEVSSIMHAIHNGDEEPEALIEIANK